VLRAVDIDRNGTIEVPEFLTAAANYQTLLKPRRLKVAVDLFDLDFSGTITLDEFKSVLKYHESDEVWEK